MKNTRTTFVTGGARSGKSTFAEKLASEYSKVTYVATAEAGDGEMQKRIERHRQRRPEGWATVEAPLRPHEAVKNAQTTCVLLDCVSIWVSNLLLRYWDEHDGFVVPFSEIEFSVLSEVDYLAQVIEQSDSRVIVVSNEVGSGLVPTSRMGRYYRDLLGIANQKIAEAATDVYWCVSGIPVRIKGEQTCQEKA